jgi:hypothetical protein
MTVLVRVMVAGGVVVASGGWVGLGVRVSATWVRVAVTLGGGDAVTVAVRGADVAVGGTGVAVGGSGVSVGMEVAVRVGTVPGVAVGGMGVVVGGSGV